MTDTALLDDRFARLAARGEATLAQTRSKREEFILSAQQSVSVTLDELLPAIRALADGLRLVAQRRHTEAVRAVHGAFLLRLHLCLAIARDAQEQAKMAAVLGGKELARAEQLAASLSELEELH